jgi:iron complex transport system ATP-binding protein
MIRTDNSLLEVKNLSFSYEKDVPVLEDVSLSLAAGAVTVLLGANGCGKSTLFHLLTGRLKPTQGNILLNGQSIADIKRKEFAKTVAAVHQYNVAPDDITVKSLVAMGRTPYQNAFSYGYSKEDEAAVCNALKLTETTPYAERPVKSLSGGQKQRVWLAMALAQSPKILLLDEITTYLDIHYQYEILNLIRRLNRQQGITVLMVLHDINQALEFCDNAVIMKNGRVLSSGCKSDVITKETLDNAFEVQTTLTDLNGRRYCFIENKTEEKTHGC